MTQASEDQPRENSHETIAALYFPGDHTAQNLAVGDILLAAGLWSLSFVLFRLEDLLFTAAALLCEPVVVKYLAKDYPAADATTGLRTGPEESQEIIVADLTLEGA